MTLIEDNMDQKDIVFAILNHLTFRDVLGFSLTNKYIRNIVDSEEYWQYRVESFGLLPSYQSYSDMPPRIRYAWTVIKSHSVDGNTKVKSHLDSKSFSYLDRSQTAIYLTNRPNLLFPGFEYLIGTERFLHKCIDSNNLELTKYIINSGPSRMIIFHALTSAIEKDEREIGFYLSETFGNWDQYNVRYLDLSEYAYRPDLVFNFVKFGYNHPVNDDNVVAYLAGLVERKAVVGLTDRSYTTYDAETRFVEVIKQYSIESRDIFILTSSLGKCGTVTMVKVFLDMVGNMLDYNDLIYSITKHDRVEILNHVLNIRQDKVSIANIRSVAVYQLLMDRSDIIDTFDLYKAVLIGGNPGLFYRILPELISNVPPVSLMKLIDYMSPFMIEVLVDSIMRDGHDVIEMIREVYDLQGHNPIVDDILKKIKGKVAK